MIEGFRQAGPGARNGMPGFRDYTYRGEKTLEAELPYECEGGCGRRLETDRWPRCAVCRGGTYYEPGECSQCGYKPGSRNCRIICGGEAGAPRRRQHRGPGLR